MGKILTEKTTIVIKGACIKKPALQREVVVVGEVLINIKLVIVISTKV